LILANCGRNNWDRTNTDEGTCISTDEFNCWTEENVESNKVLTMDTTNHKPMSVAVFFYCLDSQKYPWI
jgi:hypothetical protein